MTCAAPPAQHRLDDQTLAAVQAVGSDRVLRAGEYVFRQDDPASDLFLIREGRLRVSLETGSEELELAELGAGEFFGEMGSLEGQPRSTSVSAITAARVTVISKAALDALLEGAPGAAARVYKQIVTELGRRLKRANDLLLERYRERSNERDLMHLLVHDLRSPLSVAEVGAAQLLDHRDRSGALTPAQERTLRRIRRSHALALQLADEVLEVGRSESGVAHEEATTLEAVLLGAIPAALARVDTPQLEEQDLASLEALGRALARADIHISVPRDLARTAFLTDRLRMIQVLLNLVGNAVKYAPGYLHIEAARRDGGMLRIAVADRGAGIPPGFRSSVFQRFRQADAKKKGVTRGFGFGLAAAKALVDSLGGRIWVESEPEKRPGAVFRFEVPFRMA